MRRRHTEVVGQTGACNMPPGLTRREKVAIARLHTSHSRARRFYQHRIHQANDGIRQDCGIEKMIWLTSLTAQPNPDSSWWRMES